MTTAKTNTIAKSATEQRQRKAAHAAQYAPKSVVKTATKNGSETQEDLRLRKIVVETLDALKKPDAVPSKIIMDALKKASKSN